MKVFDMVANGNIIIGMYYDISDTLMNTIMSSRSLYFKL